MIGIDILDTQRLRDMVGQPHFVQSKMFCQCEWEHYLSTGSRIETLAGIFCAKESFFKALGTGIVGLDLRDVCIQYTALGQPFVVAHNRVRELLGDRDTSLSISHTKDTAVAVCVLTKRCLS